MHNKTDETKDKELFDTIALKYAKKDFYSPSVIARDYQLKALINFVTEVSGKSHFNKILEVGCGTGAGAEYLKNYYNKYVGVDYSKELISVAKNKFSNSKTEFTCDNIKDFHSKDEKFDLIFGIGILHHTYELNKVLDSFKELSDGNTIFAFLEPQDGNPFIRFLRNIRKKIDKGYSEDQKFFTKDEIRDAFKVNGFQVLLVKYQGYFTPPIAQVILKHEFLMKPIAKVAAKFDAFLDRKFDKKSSWNLAIIAKKH